MRHPNTYAGKKVVVLGLAKSGLAVSKLFHDFGAKVTVNDVKPREDCPEAGELEKLGVRVVCGSHPAQLIRSDVSLVVKNPGIKYSVPAVKKALELGIEVVTEVEVAAHLFSLPIAAVTGSNGKTTTTTWIGLMLQEAGLAPIVAGNIGTPLCDAVRNMDGGKWMVLELSSFQLKGTRQFRPNVACLLNIYETHMDYHGTMDDYIAAKRKLFANQTEQDTAVLNWDDPVCRRIIESGLTAKVLPFSAKQRLDRGVFLDFMPDANGEKREMIVYAPGEGELVPIAKVDELGIPGRHNVENALAAVAVALSAGAGRAAIASALQSFRGVEHRLEFVKSANGIDVYNDSKATNPSATVKSLESFNRPIVWVGGGLDRGTEFTALEALFKERVKAVVVLGQTKDKIKATAEKAGIKEIHSVAETANKEIAIQEAAAAAVRLAASGDVILFSPACASWDMFPSYEVRGRMFKQAVHNLLS
ncbi:MAG TPA: UDP-N-acetylmuramoyl-L-alanine--D-glutamate ligase [Bacilli bacterium]